MIICFLWALTALYTYLLCTVSYPLRTPYPLHPSTVVAQLRTSCHFRKPCRPTSMFYLCLTWRVQGFNYKMACSRGILISRSIVIAPNDDGGRRSDGEKTSRGWGLPDGLLCIPWYGTRLRVLRSLDHPALSISLVLARQKPHVL